MHCWVQIGDAVALAAAVVNLQLGAAGMDAQPAAAAAPPAAAQRQPVQRRGRCASVMWFLLNDRVQQDACTRSERYTA